MVIHPLSSICIAQYILKFDLVNNFSVDYVGFTYKLGQHFFIYRLEKFTLIKVAIFADVILVSNYHFYKGERKNIIPHYMIDIIYKPVKPSHLKKLQIMQNINNLISQVNFIFSA